MASVFTYEPDPPRVSSPWSASGSTTPSLRKAASGDLNTPSNNPDAPDPSDPGYLAYYGIAKLDVEPQDGPVEYKLHLLLRSRRAFTSLSTGNLISGSSHSKSGQDMPHLDYSGPEPEEIASKTPLSSSTQTRQHRLHQLTTQLLWRLQQSSPFHSSSAADLVLPILPEATPTLDVPKVLSPLVSGLEESKGALYEIGVSDDGAFVGLAKDELDESLVNLEAMAASLGCKIEILRRVAVGYCEWIEPGPTDSKASQVRDKLWVAEVLVRPDLPGDDDHPESSHLVWPQTQSGSLSVPTRNPSLHPSRHVEQLHVAIVGLSGAGKTSLLGILSNSLLDNGRGKSRISLLKHRHEIISGVTSSVAQELIGYSASSMAEEPPKVINYASGNVSAWNDIHATAAGGRLVFLSDLPGSLRYSKSTLRGLVSMEPDYTLLCIPANGAGSNEPAEVGEADLTLSYLDLCMKLDIPVVIVVTKLDVSNVSMKQILNPSLSAIKAAGKKPITLFRPTDFQESEYDAHAISNNDRDIVDSAIASLDGDDISNVVPIVFTSAVTGVGIGRLHALLRSLPVSKSRASNPTLNQDEKCEKLLDIDDVYEMPLSKVYSASEESKSQNDTGIVLCGRMRRGAISTGDILLVGPIPPDLKQDSKSNDSISNQPKAPYSKSLPENLTSLRLQRLQRHSSPLHAERYWQEVRVVSVRNLRQPVMSLQEKQIGTIGIDPIHPQACLGRIRKGMVLAAFPSSLPVPIPFPKAQTDFHTGFVANFPASHIHDLPASLAVGSNMVIYIRSIRASAKILAIEGQEEPQRKSSASEIEIFTLDGPENADEVLRDSNKGVPLEVKIAFSFLSSIEWIEIGSSVLAVLSTASSSSTTLTSSPSTPARGAQNLRGLVGWVCEVIPS